MVAPLDVQTARPTSLPTWHSESVEVGAVALRALTRGSVDVATRSSFAPGEAKAVAIDAHDGVAAVLVVRRRRDDAWIVDVVRFVDEDGTWTDLGSGGGTCGDLPLDRDPGAVPSLGPISTGWSVVGDQGLVTAGGFVSGDVDSVELVVGDQARIVAVRPDSPAFVIAAKAEEDHDIDAIDVRALDRNGGVVDSSAAWRGCTGGNPARHHGRARPCLAEREQGDRPRRAARSSWPGTPSV